MKSVKKLLTKLIFKLSPRLRYKVIRSLLKLQYDLPNDLCVKLADTEQELQAAFELLHDSYVQQGYMQPQLYKLRATFFHLLPSTSLIIAKKGDDVIGTVSIIRDSPHGLPLEKDFNLNHLRKNNQVISEISSLAIHRDYRGQHGLVLFPLLKFMYNYCKYYFATDIMVLATHPKLSDFFEAILLFKSIEDKVVENYGFVNGSPAVGKYLDLKLAPMMYAAVYGLKSNNKNLYKFMVPEEHGGTDFQNLKYPLRVDYRLFDTKITGKTFEEIFVNKVEILKSINNEQAKFLISYYGHDSSNESVKKLCKIIKWKDKRIMEPRYSVQCPVQIFNASNQLIGQTTANNLSVQGLSILNSKVVNKDEVYKLRIALSQFDVCELTAACVWNTNKNMGLRIIDSPQEWKDYIQNLSSSSNIMAA